jgi:histidinol-phosphate aminotransferase
MNRIFNVEKFVNHRVLGLSRTTIDFDRSQFIRLDKNENLSPFTESQLSIIKKLIDSNLLSNYGDLTATYALLGEKFSCAAGNIYLTAGADLAIKSIYETFINDGAAVVLPELAYGMHEVYSQQFGASCTKLKFNSDFEIDIDETLSCGITPKVVFLESPSGVTGKSIPDKVISELSFSLRERGSILVIDETYAGITKEFISPTIILTNPNLISVRSFSKGFGLAGIRGGLLFADTSLIQWMKKTQPMHEITSLTAKIIEESISTDEWVAPYRDFIRAGKLQIASSVNCKCFDLLMGDANFYLIKPKDSGREDLYEFAKANGILIRQKFRNGTLEGFFRVTIGSRSQNEEFLQLLHRYESS